MLLLLVFAAGFVLSHVRLCNACLFNLSLPRLAARLAVDQGQIIRRHLTHRHLLQPRSHRQLRHPLDLAQRPAEAAALQGFVELGVALGEGLAALGEGAVDEQAAAPCLGNGPTSSAKHQ